MAIDELMTLLDSLKQSGPAGGELITGADSLDATPTVKVGTDIPAVLRQAGAASSNRGLLQQLQSLAAAEQAVQPPPRVKGGTTQAQAGSGSFASGLADEAKQKALGFVPVIGGLLQLLGIGKSKPKELPPLETFQLPAQIRAEAGLSANGDTYLIDRGAGGQIRPAPVSPVAANVSGGGGSQAAGGGAQAAAITVQVNAMDSQSFLDRRDDIARAVREAMLHSSSLNDVVSEV